MESTDAKEVTNEGVRKRRFGRKDFGLLAESIYAEYKRRKENRKHLERVWGEIDRQIAMRPSFARKLDARGNPDAGKAWMSEVELPLQAQTLEVLTADARRMLFPPAGPWFVAHAAMTDDYLRRVDYQSLVAGDESEVPSIVNQDNADKLVRGALDYWHSLYDFRGNVDLINAETFKYGVGVGRARRVRADVHGKTRNGVVKRTVRIPMLVPRSIKHIYLDDSFHALANEGYVIEPMILDYRRARLVDMQLAASKGNNEPTADDGGWMPGALVGLEPDKDGYIDIIEAEGDFVVPRKTTGSVVLTGMIVTVVRGKAGGKDNERVIRMRDRQWSQSSYIEFPYHRESCMSAYAASPLMKGWPIQVAASEALCDLMDAAMLNVMPPIGYDRNDQAFAADGGPRIYPGALWGTIGDVVPHKISDPATLVQVYAGLLTQYSDVTGVNAPRLGAQTLSHTTAFAKEAELSRGTVRTVDYVESSLKAPLTQWLYLAYEIGRPLLRDTDMYIADWEAWVTVSKEHLPDAVVFEAHGAGGPAEEQAKRQNKMAAVQMAIQIDSVAKGYGQDTGLKLPEIVQNVLREGGWTDVDALVERGTGVSAGPAQPSPVEAAAGPAEINPAAALQAIAFGGQQ